MSRPLWCATSGNGMVCPLSQRVCMGKINGGSSKIQGSEAELTGESKQPLEGDTSHHATSAVEDRPSLESR